MSQFQRIIQMMFKWISNNILLFLSCSTTNLTHLTAEFTRTEHTLCLYRTNEEKCFVSLKCYVCLNCCTARTVLSIQTKSMYALATNSMWIFRYFASVLSRVRFSSLFQPRIKRERRNEQACVCLVLCLHRHRSLYTFSWATTLCVTVGTPFILYFVDIQPILSLPKRTKHAYRMPNGVFSHLLP